MQEFRNSFSKLESPLSLNDRFENSCSEESKRVSLYFAKRSIRVDPMAAQSVSDKFEIDEADTKALIARDLDIFTDDQWTLPYFHSIANGLHDPELSLLRSVCPERKLPARCLRG